MSPISSNVCNPRAHWLGLDVVGQGSARLQLAGCFAGLLIGLFLDRTQWGGALLWTLCLGSNAQFADHLGPLSAAHSGMWWGVLAGMAVSTIRLATIARSQLCGGVCAMALGLTGMIVAMRIVDGISAPALAPATALCVMAATMGLGHWAGLQVLSGIIKTGRSALKKRGIHAR